MLGTGVAPKVERIVVLSVAVEGDGLQLCNSKVITEDQVVQMVVVN